MPILDIALVQQQVPEWREYCTLPAPPSGSARTPDEVLVDRVQLAEDELSEYVAVTEATVTRPLARHLLVLIRKSLFDLVHGAKPFERTPQVVTDYNRTIKTLERYQSGEVSIEQPAQQAPDDDDDGPRYVRMGAKERRFSIPNSSWFR